MSNETYVLNIIVASQIFSSYSTYINFIIGLIGNLLNILVFTNLKIFRFNRCAFYLIAESIYNIIQLTQNLINEIWKSKINGIDPITISLIWCKLRTILPQWFRLVLASIVCSAAIDQYFCTNHIVYLRRLSSLKIARYEIFISSILSFIHTISVGIFLEINSLSVCIINNSILINYYSYFFYPLLNGLFPIILSSIFSILSYRNVRRIIRRQIPINRRRLDQQLTAMIFVRVIFFVLLQLPFTIYRIVTLNWIIIRVNTIGYATIAWIQSISLALVYSNHVVISLFIF